MNAIIAICASAAVLVLCFVGNWQEYRAGCAIIMGSLAAWWLGQGLFVSAGFNVVWSLFWAWRWWVHRNDDDDHRGRRRLARLLGSAKVKLRTIAPAPPLKVPV